MTYPIPNFNGCTVEVWDLMNNFIPHFTMTVITYPCWNESYFISVKWAKFHENLFSNTVTLRGLSEAPFSGRDELDPLQWRHNDHDIVSNHQPHGCLLNRLFRRRSKKTSKLRVTGLCAGNSPETGEFLAQMASYAENVFIWWRHHAAARLWHVWVITSGKTVGRNYPSIRVIAFLIKQWV